MQAKITYTNGDNTIYDNVDKVVKVYVTSYNADFWCVYSQNFGMVEILANTVKSILID